MYSDYFLDLLFKIIITYSIVQFHSNLLLFYSVLFSVQVKMNIRLTSDFYIYTR